MAKKLYGAYVHGLLQNVSHCKAALCRNFPNAEIVEVKPAGKGSFMRRKAIKV